MNFNAIFEKVQSGHLRSLAKTQTVVECKITPAHGVMISKVLSITADAKVNIAEVFTGEARFSGMVNFSALITSGEQREYALCGNADFSDKVESGAIASDMSVDLIAEVLGVEVTSVSGNELKLATVVEISLLAPVSTAVDCLSLESEGAVLKSELVKCGSLIAKQRAQTTLSATFEEKNMVKPLLITHRAIITDKKASVDAVKIEGVILTEVVGEREGDLIVSKIVETEFLEEFPALNASVGDTVTADLSLTGEVVEEEGEGVVLSLEYAIAFSYSVYACTTKEVVVDAFSPEYELKLKREEAIFSAFKASELYRERIDGSVTLKNEMPLVDSILACPSMRINLTQSRVLEGEVIAEGILYGNIVYYSAESNSKNSLSIELPFSRSLSVSGAVEGDGARVSAKVLGTQVKIRRGNEIELKCEVIFDILLEEEQKCALVTEVAQGDARQNCGGALRVHTVESGESLWEVAKTLCAHPDEIRRQNEQVIFPLTGGEKIIFYKKLDKKY